MTTVPHTPSRRPSVLVIGDILIDEMRTPLGSVDVPGGSALNVAVGLAVLGVPSILAGMVGDDPAGALLRTYAHTHGVSLISTRAPRGTGRAISDRTEGEPRYSFSEASRSRTLIPTDELHHVAARADLVVVSGFPFDEPAEIAILLSLIRADTRVAIDANPRPGLLRDRVAFAEGLLAVAARAALVKIGAEDAELVFDEPLPAATARVLSAGADAVLETAGPGGAALVTARDRVSAPIATADGPVVDTMGAGDATFATVVEEMAASSARRIADPHAVLVRAMNVAAATIRASGGLLRLPA